METTTKEIAAVLRSTETMADQFAILVQRRVGRPTSHAEILAVMKKMSPKQLSMKKVVAKIRQQRKK
jgi:oligoribonuclease NrnB/cAMP/cGMP phosphodiesterase (DHH superfamily)